MDFTFDLLLPQPLLCIEDKPDTVKREIEGRRSGVAGSVDRLGVLVAAENLDGLILDAFTVHFDDRVGALHARSCTQNARSWNRPCNLLSSVTSMEAERVVLASFIAVTFVFLTALLIAIDWAAAKGRLRRNQFVGIRTPSTMRSDHAWIAGHRAALRLTPVHALTGLAVVIAILVTRTVAGLNIVGVGGASVFVVVALFTAVVAGRAAKAAEESPDG
jgi:hypothetical protein